MYWERSQYNTRSQANLWKRLKAISIKILQVCVKKRVSHRHVSKNNEQVIYQIVMWCLFKCHYGLKHFMLDLILSVLMLFRQEGILMLCYLNWNCNTHETDVKVLKWWVEGSLSWDFCRPLIIEFQFTIHLFMHVTKINSFLLSQHSCTYRTDTVTWYTLLDYILWL